MNGNKIHLKKTLNCTYYITVKTGLRIGAGQNVYILGEPDQAVIKTRHYKDGRILPYIPGSSIKGRLRSIFERKYINWAIPKLYLEEKLDEIMRRMPDKYRNTNNNNINKDEKKKLARKFIEELGFSITDKQHGYIITYVGPLPEEEELLDLVLVNKDKKDKVEAFLKLFGVPVERQLKARKIYGPTRIRISDAYIVEPEEEEDYVEEKSEAKIDRLTAAADPRTSERVKPQTKFVGKIFIDIYEGLDRTGDEKSGDAELFKEILKELFESLNKHGLGGATSRGYGQVEAIFEDESESDPNQSSQ